MADAVALATVAPPAVGLDGNAGTSIDVARADHTHPVRIQRAVITTDANGNATWTFARPFVNLPAVTALPNTTGNPIAISITAKSTTSVTFNCRQSKPLPNTILTLTALVNLNIFQDPAAGVQLDVFAGEVTQ